MVDLFDRIKTAMDRVTIISQSTSLYAHKITEAKICDHDFGGTRLCDARKMFQW